MNTPKLNQPSEGPSVIGSASIALNADTIRATTNTWTKLLLQRIQIADLQRTAAAHAVARRLDR